MDRRQETDAAVVDAEHGHTGAEKASERTQHRAVAAEDDRDVGRTLIPFVFDQRHTAGRSDCAQAHECGSDAVKTV